MIRFAALLILLLPSVARAVDSAGIDQGRAALDAARLAYQGAGAFRETFEYTVEMPDGRKEPKGYAYGVGPAGEVFLVLSNRGQEVVRFVAREGRLVGTQLNVPGRYAEVPYEGDFAVSLRRIGGEAMNLSSPPAIVARQGGNLAAFLDSLRLGILGRLEIVGSRSAVAPDRSPVVEVELRAENGSITLGIDTRSHRLRTARLVLGEGEQQVKADARFTFTAGAPAAGFAFPDLHGRSAVGSFAELEQSDYPLGQPAPEVALRSLEGGAVRLADLRGSVKAEVRELLQE